jgi:hypothetical protein
VVHLSGRYHPDTVSLSLQRVAWHCQWVPPIFVHLLRRESADLWKAMINIILTRPLLPLGQNIDQVDPMWIPNHGEHCCRTADCLAFKCLGIFMIREPDLSVLIREIKSGIVQRNKHFQSWCWMERNTSKRHFNIVTRVCLSALDSL